MILYVRYDSIAIGYRSIMCVNYSHFCGAKSCIIYKKCNGTNFNCITGHVILSMSLTLSISQPGRKLVIDDVSELCLRAMSGGIRVHKSPIVSFVGPTSNRTSCVLNPFFVAVISLDKGSCFLFK